MKKIIALFATSALLWGSVNALSEEIWNSTRGKVINTEDLGTTALWRYNENTAQRGVIYIKNLAGVYTNRGAYQGYWAQEQAEVLCKNKRDGVNGKSTAYWGGFRIEFIDKDYPSRWQAKWGYCEQPLTRAWKGTPITLVKTPKTDESLYTTSEIIKFARGASSAVYEKIMFDGKKHYYYFTAHEGQMLNLDLSSQQNNAFFAIYKPDYQLAEVNRIIKVEGDILNSEKTTYQGVHWLGQLPLSGEYLIVISATRGNASYNLRIFIK
jgi:hypothetical protein